MHQIQKLVNIPNSADTVGCRKKAEEIICRLEGVWKEMESLTTN